MASLKTYWGTVRGFARAHKIWSALIVIAAVVILWWLWGALFPAATQTQYVLGTVTEGTVVSTVSESGQVSANQQLNISPQVSGQITAIDVTPGEFVHAGQAIATIDPTTALEQLQSAKEDLQSSQLALAQLQEPATQLTIAQQQDALSQSQQSLTTLYQSTFSDITDTFLDLPTIISGLQNIDLGTQAAGSFIWNIDYYETQAAQYNPEARSYRDAAYNDYEAARASYDQTFNDFKSLSSTPTQAQIEQMLQETYTTTGLLATASKSSSDLVQFYIDQLTENGSTPKTIANTQITSLNTYLTEAQGHLTTLLNDTNSLQTDQQSINEKQLTLQQTQAGPDTLQVQQDQLNIQKAQQAVTQAQQTLSEYYITAPFDGTIAAVNLNKFDQAGSGTAIATLITNAQYADLTINEVDAAKLQLGQKTTITFDAIPDLTLTGTVAEIDSVGTVSQGVVSYDVKVSFDTQDPRVKSGMTVNATIQTAVAENALIVPSSAVKTQGTASYVQVFTPPLATSTLQSGSQGIATTQVPVDIPVTVGISDTTNTQILSGLTQGQQIVVRTTSGSATPTAASTATNRTGFGGGGFGGAGAGAVLRGG